MTEVRTRFAPSPTGKLHHGGARTALFCYLHARKNKGKFLLRIEDTDKERSKEIYTQNIKESLHWLGLSYDEEPVYQSQQDYKSAADSLLAAGHAYRCTCTPEELDKMREEQIKRGENPHYDGRNRDANIRADAKNCVIRIKNPLSGEVSFQDIVQGEVKILNEELDDMILVRADGTPTYNFCAVVDDIRMGITDVIRGEDHLRNSLRQCNLYAALGSKAPRFAHLPMIHNSEGARLSKRDGAGDLLSYRDRGFLPEAICSYLARLGWSAGDKEIFTMDELVEMFDLKDVNKSPAQYDENKLLWMNGEFIKNASAEMLRDAIIKMDESSRSGHYNLRAIDLHKDRCDSLIQLRDEIILYDKEPREYNDQAIHEFVNDLTSTIITQMQDKLASLDDSTQTMLPNEYKEITKEQAQNALLWHDYNIKLAIKEIVTKQDVKFPQVAMPLRIAITGATESPAIDKVIAVLGKEESLRRIDKFHRHITKLSKS